MVKSHPDRCFTVGAIIPGEKTVFVPTSIQLVAIFNPYFSSDDDYPTNA